jgi:hypothetical protein
MSATSPAVPKSANPTAPAMVSTAHEPGVYGSNISVTRLLWVKTPDMLPSSRIPCLYFHAQGSCSRMLCLYKDDHVKHNAADTAALVAYSATAKAAPDRA